MNPNDTHPSNETQLLAELEALRPSLEKMIVRYGCLLAMQADAISVELYSDDGENLSPETRRLGLENEVTLRSLQAFLACLTCFPFPPMSAEPEGHPET
ncbi:hypothetical protein CLV78_1255 [Aliiruegeria haliotis]|uniref:Uncharacterized protein n=1 Tax=Aliiruegeria haliotis TaxID=1280846 RepID=A0A2T0RDT0_9RHOB|nr:hypothetical protein [Aliiruegeria haliotis]PRY19289.1 hypothetical protein CLV78_1255 [Aliiruegeria haliotis]